MDYILGIDSGGTKFLVRACTLSGASLGVFTGTAAGFRFKELSDGIREVSLHIDACLAQFMGRREDCRYLVVGSTGIDSTPDYQRIRAIYDSLSGFSCPIWCGNDSEVAHYAATGGVGVLVISGTGSVAFGRNKLGEIARSGGWWFTMGADEGSGTSIALSALQHMALVYDSRCEASLLSHMLSDRLRLTDRADLIRIGRGTWSSWSQYRLPQLVDEAAEKGDHYAKKLLEDASFHTFTLGDSVIKKLKLDVEESFIVGAWGSAIVKSRLHFEAFKRRFQEKYTHVRVVLSHEDAAMGAVRMGINFLAGGRL